MDSRVLLSQHLAVWWETLGWVWWARGVWAALRGPRSDPWTITTEGSVDNPGKQLFDIATTAAKGKGIRRLFSLCQTFVRDKFTVLSRPSAGVPLLAVFVGQHRTIRDHAWARAATPIHGAYTRIARCIPRAEMRRTPPLRGVHDVSFQEHPFRYGWNRCSTVRLPSSYHTHTRLPKPHRRNAP